jgi:hypothetical protein
VQGGLTSTFSHNDAYGCIDSFPDLPSNGPAL